MKIKFTDIKEDDSILLNIISGNKEMEMDATLIKFVKADIAIIELDTPSTQVLRFDNVTVHMIYTNEAGIPYIFRSCKIVHYKGQYVIQIFGEGNRYNRRNCFRVGISKTARMRTMGRGEENVLVRDISLSGFGLTDRKKELHLEMGTRVAIRFEDLGHEIDLEGPLVRIEEHDDYIIYGFTISKSCKDLSSYVTYKQRQKRL